jgi:hypothetical protein
LINKIEFHYRQGDTVVIDWKDEDGNRQFKGKITSIHKDNMGKPIGITIDNMASAMGGYSESITIAISQMGAIVKYDPSAFQFVGRERK